MKQSIVLIWKIAAGKDYAGEYLAKKLWWEYLSISSGLRIIARDRGIEETRENLIEIWKEVTQQYGDGYLAEILVEKSESDILVITWPRQLGQLKYLRENTDSIFIGIDADPEIRYQRLWNRWKAGENISFEQFLQEEQMEEAANQSVSKCLQQCDIFLENNRSLKDFEKMLNKIDPNIL